MITERSKQLRGKKTKKKILDVALSLFSKYGYDHVTVEEIVKASGTSKGSFYTHFQSKYEIFLEKFKEIDDFYLSFSQSISPEASSFEKILTFVDAQMNYIQHELGKDIMRVIYSNALIPNPQNYFFDKNRPLNKILRTYVEEGWEKREIKRDVTVEEIVVILTRCMRGSVYDWCMSVDDFDLQQECHKLFTIVLHGLKHEG